MKRHLLVLTILCGFVTAHAAPVGLESARSLGQQFVHANFAYASQSDDLVLVYSQPSFYVFNVGESGFVILSADDSYRPIIGYSDEGVFNPDDMAPALQDYLEGLNAYRSYRSANSATMEIRQEWAQLRSNGRLTSYFPDKAGTYLVQTKWNQNYPYNYCCPADPDGPGGHVYAGCVATAGAQVMKYWNHPLQGMGSHTYTPEDNPQYGPITVNFGAATYDWDNMPNTISSSSPIEQIEAVGQLIYHVGVSVDMNYRPSSSGAVTGNLCNTMPAYFSYTNQMQHYYRESYSRDVYLKFIYDQIDMSWPMLHRGNGHAYVLDGYDEYGLCHFNWGWGGSNDAFYDIDGHDYAEGESVICNCVPAGVYNATPNAPTNLVVTPSADNQLSATVTWNNPTVTLSGQALSAIDQVVVLRNNKVVYSEDNVSPGAAMSFVDDVPCFDAYVYTVYAVLNGQRGKSIVSGKVSVGPSCQWKFVVSSSNFQGWGGAYIAVYNPAGTEVGRVTVTNATPTIVDFDMPLGLIKLAWVPSETTTGNYTITMNVKDSDGVSVYNYSGYNVNMEDGVFFEGNNSCGATSTCTSPYNLRAVQSSDDEQTILLQWESEETPDYGYMIYRDSLLVRLITDGTTEYLDENVPVGGHCYQVAALSESGMSGEFTNMDCEASGACHAPRNFNFETTANFKCKLVWDRPSPDDGLSGYALYRRTDTTDYKRIKLLNANNTSYTDNGVNSEGDYYYKLVAHYEDLDCDSYPAAYLYDEHQYYVHFYYSPTGVDETVHNAINLYPNPTTGLLKVEAQAMQHIAVYNMLGQQLHEADVSDDMAILNLKGYESGMYLVKVQTSHGVYAKKVFVIE